MIQISLELIIALIGAITGVISLIWHIIKERPNLVLESVSFKWENKHNKEAFNGQWIRVKITLRNLSKLSTTLEDVYVKIGNQVLTPDYFIPSDIDISGYSSQSLGYYFTFDDKEFKEFFDKEGRIELGILIIHTFGKIDKRGKTSFKTGLFTLK